MLLHVVVMLTFWCGTLVLWLLLFRGICWGRKVQHVKRIFRITLAVEVEPETDLKHYQPGLVCATLAGTDWKWVDDTPENAIRNLLAWAWRGHYQGPLPHWSMTEPLNEPPTELAHDAFFNLYMLDKCPRCGGEIEAGQIVCKECADVLMREAMKLRLQLPKTGAEGEAHDE